MRRRRVLSVVAVGLVAACGRHRPVSQFPNPAGAHRFEILAVADSTFAFLTGDAPWVRAGLAGISVDPQRRDALVARFVVQRRIGDTATALVTGQTGHLTPSYVALLEPPRVGMVRQRGFWIGLLTGGAAGAATAILAR
ncbi:MAG: hypothetical protein JO180_01485 [Gemmatirosa sp.]|nr:hypothetical protein [Gemmatirosa sp.]